MITDLEIGGTPLLLNALARGLIGVGFEVGIVSLKPLPGKGESAVDLGSFPGEVCSLNMSSGKDLVRGVSRLARVLNRVRPDFLFSMLVHANLVGAMVMPFLENRPVLVESIQTLQDKPLWHWGLQGVLSGFAEAVVVPSGAILRKIEGFGGFRRGVVIANGIDVERFAGAIPLAEKELPWEKEAVVVGYVGRFDPVKNLPLMMRAFARLSSMYPLVPLRLAMVGYGEQEEELLGLSKSLHIAPRVHFLGRTKTPERFYKSFACHCLPSSVEGFGMTLVEAMAAGVPVVAVRNEVTEAIVREPIDGRLFAAGSEDSLVQAFQKVMIDPPVAGVSTVLPVSTLEHVRREFSVEKMVGKYAEFLNNFCC